MDVFLEGDDQAYSWIYTHYIPCSKNMAYKFNTLILNSERLHQD